VSGSDLERAAVASDESFGSSEVGASSISCSRPVLVGAAAEEPLGPLVGAEVEEAPPLFIEAQVEEAIMARAAPDPEEVVGIRAIGRAEAATATVEPPAAASDRAPAASGPASTVVPGLGFYVGMSPMPPRDVAAAKAPAALRKAGYVPVLSARLLGGLLARGRLPASAHELVVEFVAPAVPTPELTIRTTFHGASKPDEVRLKMRREDPPLVSVQERGSDAGPTQAYLRLICVCGNPRRFEKWLGLDVVKQSGVHLLDVSDDSRRGFPGELVFVGGGEETGLPLVELAPQVELAEPRAHGKPPT